MSSCGFQNKTQIDMKKVFITIMAIAAFAACNKEAAVETPQGDAIAFGDAFVDHSTKAIYETANDLTGFTVWGNVADVALYGTEGATVTRSGAALGSAWTCSVTRYWTPSSTFKFAAIANGTGTDCVNGIPTKISYTLNDEEPADLVYGTAAATTDPSCAPSGNITNGIVSFTLEHLLARVKVSFENQIEEDDYTYAISNVTLSTWDKGVYTIGAATPWAREGEGTTALPYTGLDALASGATQAAGAQVLIPGAPMTLGFTYELKLNGTTIYTNTVSETVSVDLVKSHSYNLNVQLKAGGKIDFTVVDGGLGAWEDAGTSNI